MATPKLKQQLELAKLYDFPNVSIPVDEAEEAMQALEMLQDEINGHKGTQVPNE